MWLYFKYNIENLKNDVISAEIAELYWGAESIDYEIIVINIVDNEKLNELFDDLTKIDFNIYNGGPIKPKGFALKLNYIDGYELICNTCIVRYNNENKAISQKDLNVTQDIFYEFLLKYKI